MMSFIILALFVHGVYVVINSTAEHFGGDAWLNDFYWYNTRTYDDRPLWQRTILKPTFQCNVCMSSVWGTVGYYLIGWESAQDWILHCVVCAALIAGVNYIQSKI